MTKLGGLSLAAGRLEHQGPTSREVGMTKLSFSVASRSESLRRNVPKAFPSHPLYILTRKR